jgi:hypothetical protein
MNRKLLTRCLIITFCLFTNSIIAKASLTNNDHTAYFKAIVQANQLPKGAKAIYPATKKKVEAALALMKKNNIKPLYKLPTDFTTSPDTSCLNTDGDTQIVLYEGRFNNQKAIDYLFLAINGGSLATDTVDRVYQRQGNKLIPLHFDADVSHSLYNDGEDLSQFYLWVARPFAYTQQGKTYLRFREYAPVGEYDPSKVYNCTYIWKKDRFDAIPGQPRCEQAITS